jgi:Pyruvate formate lyase-like
VTTITLDKQVGLITADPSKLRSFEDYWQVFKIQLDWLIEQAIQLNEYMGAVHQEMMPSALSPPCWPPLPIQGAGKEQKE